MFKRTSKPTTTRRSQKSVFFAAVGPEIVEAVKAADLDGEAVQAEIADLLAAATQAAKTAGVTPEWAEYPERMVSALDTLKMNGISVKAVANEDGTVTLSRKATRSRAQSTLR